MAVQSVAAYGTWKSEISSDLISRGSREFCEVFVGPGDKATIYLLEARPQNGGKATIVAFEREGDGYKEGKDILDTKYDVSAGIHGYGGGAATIGKDGCIVFTDGNTNGVFMFQPGAGMGSDDVDGKERVKTLIKGKENVKYADFDISPDGQWILAVKEEAFTDGREEKNSVVALNRTDGKEIIIVEGADFYSHPKWSPDGGFVSWMQWFHPDMPWTGSEVYVASWKEGGLEGKYVYVAGRKLEQAVCQPRWSGNGSLWFVNDPEGVWQLFRYEVGEGVVEKVGLRGWEDVEVGAREVRLGNVTYIQLSKEKWIITYCRNAVNGLLLYDIPTQSVTELPLDLVHIEFKGLARISNTEFAVLGSTPTAPMALYTVDITKPTEKILLKSSSSIVLSPEIFSPLKPISFPSTLGTSHAVFAPPHNTHFKGPSESKPPLIVSIHGGPTSDTKPGLDLETQYFTSRGYAYVHVNYTGSIGFGRAYRQALNTQWGILDIEDTISCVNHLVKEGLVDSSKVGIRGGSAGGYTVLQALVTYPSFFAAGCSLYGVSDLEDLMGKTHKFESYYGFALLFPPGATHEEKERVYKERSPCFHADRIESPLVLLQGDKDRVVPLEQATGMESVLRGLGKDVRLVVYEGEGHGWKMEGNIRESIEEEERLWGRCLVR